MCLPPDHFPRILHTQGATYSVNATVIPRYEEQMQQLQIVQGGILRTMGRVTNVLFKINYSESISGQKKKSALTIQHQW